MDNNQEQGKSILPYKDFSKTVTKRTERLVTAIYMVTDCVEHGEPGRVKVRTLGMDLLSLSYAIPENGPYEKGALLGDFILIIFEMESLVRIFGAVGIISEMNAAILLAEFEKLREAAVLEQGNSFGGKTTGAPVKSFVLDPKVFEYEETEDPKLEIADKGQSKRHDFYLTKSPLDQEKFSSKNKGSFEKTASIKKETPSKKFDIAVKISRRNTILKLIKDRREVTIKDISQLISDCSEKTIQRELMSLVGQGILKKTGEKRWSKYSIA